MPSRLWKTPFYRYPPGLNIDVTSSISYSLGPHRCIQGRLPRVLNEFPRPRLLDFGAGALRHTLPLLQSKVTVCAVEYAEAFERPEGAEALKKAQRYKKNFAKLVWPAQFQEDKRRFECALLSYVIQVIPEKDERDAVIEFIAAKLVDNGAMLYLSRTNQVTATMRQRPLRDGFWMGVGREYHSFYTEFSPQATNDMMKRHGLVREASSGRKTERSKFFCTGSGMGHRWREWRAIQSPPELTCGDAYARAFATFAASAPNISSMCWQALM